MTAPKLVIFDCDGVLVDTETVANKVLSQQLVQIGLHMSPLECHHAFTGKTMERCLREVEALSGQKLPEDWADMVRAADIEEFRKGVPAIPGLRDVISHLQYEGIPYCVGSSGRYEKMHVTLGSSGLLPLFKDVLFSAQDCKDGKPAPDIFLYAAKGMNTEPKDAVVIEDSIPGIEAGLAAGMRVFGYCGDPLAEPEKVKAMGATPFEHMSELPALLGV
ncbi:HAD family hydrolase [Polycladidibacter hongkongensis]|uniref:HAD family hydrolase n=1 Tax=Polycladidibacter hongkongensis TaxID=1647556 RepID=UPI000832137E|nr:HAD family phosphatase [Pseudovibrio hongkongensis]